VVFLRLERNKIFSWRAGLWVNTSCFLQTYSSAVLSSELTALPDLYGYLKIPGDEIVKIKIEYRKMDEVNLAFLQA